MSTAARIATGPHVVLTAAVDGRLLAVMSEPGACGTCGRITSMFVNRDGRTACCECDKKRGEETNVR